MTLKEALAKATHVRYADMGDYIYLVPTRDNEADFGGFKITREEFKEIKIKKVRVPSAEWRTDGGKKNR
jgi:hypothetical protein